MFVVVPLRLYVETRVSFADITEDCVSMVMVQSHLNCTPKCPTYVALRALVLHGCNL